MSNLPMYFPPAPFNLDEARFCAKLVETGYAMYTQWQAQNKPEPGHFHWTPTGPALHYSRPIWGAEKLIWIFKRREPFAFVAWDDAGSAYLVFRGTESVEDWIDDIDADQTTYTPVAGYGSVHDGFMKLYASMAEAVMMALKALPACQKLFICGHSLGSGLSTLAVPDVIARSGIHPPALRHYNLASPRVGDSRFVTAYNRNGVPTYRVVNSCDLVPTVPPPVFGDYLYEHVGTPLDFSAQYGSLAKNHNAETAYGYALAHPDDPQSGG